MRAFPERSHLLGFSLDHRIIEHLAFGPEEIDCADMELTRDSPENPLVFKGPGSIKRDGDGRLVFKIYLPARPAGSQQLGEWWGTSKAGQLIKPSAYYSLNARDRDGQVWTAGSILPGCYSGPGAFIVRGSVHELRAAKSLDGFSYLRPRLRMLFVGDVEIPCNQVTKTRTIRGDEDEALIFPNSTLNLARFSSCGFDFLIQAGPGELLVEVTTEGTMPPHLETRVIEALQFALSTTLHCRISERTEGALVTVKIVSGKSASDGARTYPPLDLHTPEAHGRPMPTWQMFDRYLAYILPHEGPDWHPCSIYLHKAREAGMNSPDARALGTSVAVEGIVNLLHRDLGKPSEDFKAAVSALKTFAAGWPGVPGWDGNDGLRGRLQDLIGQLNNVRPADRLRELAARGLVEKRLMNSWKTLRNTMAHAEMPDARKRQQFFDGLYSATVLLNQLVFSAIGYEGYYSDYSIHGFPVRRYPPGSDTQTREPPPNSPG